ncbi:dicarboxylate/amino acid:cation symporter [Paenibacillus radicis (ex Gao et al. 2016)]|uniref:Amino acid:proton symporter n=1 Tax=Paenibacillus radicis (ex Gao et al. 2016) TaxID=1737354 RepID=A0A917H1S5_9BACL|nr:dicarboxylate/amino acid:cation symporter [Paenibacillus radicis (ex Gao et al. 2016)]GGG64101.1 amino acid:proton symporter [Paenibacillus radicis (ex Gao et al. 2016)]
MENNLVTAFQDNWITLGVSAVLLALLYFMAKKRVGFGTRVLVALGLGLVAGVIFNNFQLKFEGVGTIGSIYVSLIRMIVIPLVFVLVINSIISITNIAFLKKIGIKTVAWFLGTTGVAAIIGLLVALAINPAGTFEASQPEGFEAREVPSFFQVILDLVPSNPVNEAATGKVLPVLIFALFIAIAIVKVGSKKPEAVQPVKALFASLTEVLHQVVKFVLRFTPYGVYALIAVMAAKYGLETLKPLATLILVSYIALIIHFVFVFGGLVAFVGKLNPLRFFKKAYPTVAVGFTTRSSYATLPINLEVITKRLGVSPRIASFVAPLGATMNFNGCGGIWPAIVSVFVASVYGIHLSFTDYILIVAVSIISSIGVAGVPGPASISTTVVLTALGLPLEGLAMVVAVESLIDMGRTAVNATGTTVTAVLVANSEGELDREVFNSNDNDELELNPA